MATNLRLETLRWVHISKWVVCWLFLSTVIPSCFFSHRSNDAGKDNPNSDADIAAFVPDAFASEPNPTCGNGLIESNEACDDGNNEDGDTCSSNCTEFDLCPDQLLDGDFQIPNRPGYEILLLEKCTVINGSLIIKDNRLKILAGLENIKEIKGDLTIGHDYRWRTEYDASYEMYDLEDISGLRGLTTVGGKLTIGKTALVSLEGLNQLHSVGGDLIIFNDSYNDSLVSLQGLNELTYIGGSLIIEGCGFLQDLTALGQLERIGGDLAIRRNTFRPAAANLLEVFEGIESVTHLTNLDGLESLKSVQGDVMISGNSLSDIEGLSSLETIGGSLWLIWLAADDLNAFRQLTLVGSDVILARNGSLQSLFVPKSALTIGGDLYITGNNRLPTCEARSFKDQITTDNLFGEALICSNQEDPCGRETCPSARTYPYPGNISYYWRWTLQPEE